jgi:hypothetical protein
MPATTLSRKLHLAICTFSLSSSIVDSFLKGGAKKLKKTHSPTAAMHHHGYSFCEIHIKTHTAPLHLRSNNHMKNMNLYFKSQTLGNPSSVQSFLRKFLCIPTDPPRSSSIRYPSNQNCKTLYELIPTGSSLRPLSLSVSLLSLSRCVFVSRNSLL